MPEQELLLNAAVFAAVGLLLALATLRLAPGQRRAMLVMSTLMLVGVLGLAAIEAAGAGFQRTALFPVLRELALLLVAIGLGLALLAFLFRGVFARRAVPRIMADVLLVLLLIGYALYRMSAAGVNLASIITTSAVITGVIAFSLQETLGNLWGGIALQLDNTCRLGDWVRVQGVTGEIVSIRWRYLAVATNSGETVMIPNAQLIKNQVTVLARRGDERVPWRRQVDFWALYDVAPSRVIDEVGTALARAELPDVARAPVPQCTCVEFGEQGVRYGVLYWLTDLTRDLQADSVIRAHVFAALARAGIETPLPRRVLLTPNALAARRESLARGELAGRAGLLARLPLFAVMTEGEQRALATELSTVQYLAGDIISRQGEYSDSMLILADGSVAVYRDAAGSRDGAGERQHLADLVAPDYFGEMGLLTGQSRSATVIARDDVTCYRLSHDGFDAILRARPELAEVMAQKVAERHLASDAKLRAMSDDARARHSSGRAVELVQRVRAFFGLGP